jgi:hypothetical protein
MSPSDAAPAEAAGDPRCATQVSRCAAATGSGEVPLHDLDRLRRSHDTTGMAAEEPLEGRCAGGANAPGCYRGSVFSHSGQGLRINLKPPGNWQLSRKVPEARIEPRAGGFRVQSDVRNHCTTAGPRSYDICAVVSDACRPGIHTQR